jgi:hypothetical protein
MKLPALLAVVAFTSLSVLHAAPPAIPIDQALKLAMDHLAERGLTGQHYIGSLTLEDSAVVGGKRYWLARWVPSIRNNATTESGLQIDMEGNLARLTSGGSGAGAARARSDAPGVRPVGARSIR